MGIIKKKIWVAEDIGKKECEVLFDIGTSVCFVRVDVASELGTIVKLPFTQSFRFGGNTVLTAEKMVILFVNMNSHNISFYFLVVPALPYDSIIGANFLQLWRIKLDKVSENVNLQKYF